MSPAKLGRLYLETVALRDASAPLSDYDRDVIMVAEMPSYTCRHFDAAAGLCTVYERRPAMCRDYPGYGTPGRTCEHCGYVSEPPTPALVPLTGTWTKAEATA
jgi:Fe-S-cluster containining protein